MFITPLYQQHLKNEHCSGELTAGLVLSRRRSAGRAGGGETVDDLSVPGFADVVRPAPAARLHLNHDSAATRRHSPYWSMPHPRPSPHPNVLFIILLLLPARTWTSRS